MVMNAVKDVAAALGELINTTKLASGKPIHDPSMNDLKESAKVSQSEASIISFFCDGYKHNYNKQHAKLINYLTSTLPLLPTKIIIINQPDLMLKTMPHSCKN